MRDTVTGFAVRGKGKLIFPLMTRPELDLLPAVETNTDRRWGFTVAAMLALWGSASIWFSRMKLGSGLIACAVLLAGTAWGAPAKLRRLRVLWFRVSRVLALWNSRVALTVVFAGAIVPLGFIMRMAGRDPLTQRGKGGWSPRPKRLVSPTHYRRMF